MKLETASLLLCILRITHGARSSKHHNYWDISNESSITDAHSPTPVPDPIGAENFSSTGPTVRNPLRGQGDPPEDKIKDGEQNDNKSGKNNKSKIPSVNPSYVPTPKPSTRAPTPEPSLRPTREENRLPPWAFLKPSTNPTSNVAEDPLVATVAPTNSPTTTPNPSKSLNPTVSLKPSVITSAPSMEKSMLPTEKASVSPSAKASVPPTFSPTKFPTPSPTIPPSMSPTTSPSLSPSISTNPTDRPSLSPTESQEPTVSPTESFKPSDIPTFQPSNHPSLSPSFSKMPSVTPTTSMAPSFYLQYTSIVNATMILEPLRPLSEMETVVWTQSTREHITEYLKSIEILHHTDVQISFIDQVVPLNRVAQQHHEHHQKLANSTSTPSSLRRRDLQSSSSINNYQDSSSPLTIYFNATIHYRTPADGFNMKQACEDSFATHNSKYIYRNRLISSGVLKFYTVEKVSVLIPEGTSGTSRPVQSELDPIIRTEKQSLTAVILISCLSSGFLVFAVYYYFVNRHHTNIKGMISGIPDSVKSFASSVSTRTKSHPSTQSIDGHCSDSTGRIKKRNNNGEISVGFVETKCNEEEQDVSTLGDPVYHTSDNGSKKTATDNNSGVFTTTSDTYSKTGRFKRIYGGISSLAPSLTSNTQTIGDHKHDGDLLLNDVNDDDGDGQSSLRTQSSIQSIVTDNYDGATVSIAIRSGCIEEEKYIVDAPAGKLGIIVIDSPLDGYPPLVHAVKDTSPLIDDLHVGDYILSVNGEDTKEMTASEVTEFITSHSQSKRELLMGRNL